MKRALVTSLCVLSLASATRADAVPPIEFHGNVVLTDETYATILFLHERGGRAFKGPLEVQAEAARTAILDFLRASGYELAAASASVVDDHIVIEVDEGVLEKTIFVGEGTFRTIELWLELDLPGRVFNRPLLERRLRRVVLETDVARADYAVRPVADVVHSGIQLAEPRLMRGLELIRPGAPHELHIYLTREREDGKLDLGLGLTGQDGFYTRAGYRMPNVIAERDRLQVGGRIGFHPFSSRFRTESNPVGLSRGLADVRWESPSFLSGTVQNSILLEAEIIGRVREDLGIRNYFFSPLRATVAADIRLFDGLTLSAGGGVEGRFLYGIDLEPDASPLADDVSKREFRPFVTGSAEIVFNPGSIRRDRRHRLALSARYLWPSWMTEGSSSIARADLAWKKVATIGYDEFHMSARAVYAVSKLPFIDEVSIGEGFLRGPFATEIYFRRAAGAALEYRVSLSRDILKASVFYELVAYEELDPLRASERLGVANGFGVGLHILALDAFQIGTYLGAAIDRERGFDLTVVLGVEKVF